MRTRKTVVAMAAMALASTGLTACLGGGDSGDEASGSGEVVIWTSFAQDQIDGMKKDMDRLLEGEGITVDWQRVDGIDQLIKTKIAAGDVPDIAMVPQPGVMKSIVDLGAAIPLDDVLDIPALESSLVPGMLETGQYQDQQYGFVVSAFLKSIIYYPKKAYEAAGYPIPESIGELNDLTDQIRGDGAFPWCLTMESGGATGWVATDWFEDLILRYGGVDEYDQWVNHEIPFDSPLVREAAAQFEKIAFTEGNVDGGRKAIVATAFAEAAQPMFDPKGPRCWLLKQGSFFVSPDFLPPAIFDNADEELGIMPFPPAEAGGDSPILGSGDLAVLLKDNDNAKAVMAALSDPSFGEAAAPVSYYISPHKDFDASLYPSETQRTIAEIISTSTGFRFDGSDVMPAEVGAGTFWTEMTAWINGDTSLDDALKTIDASWPS